MKLPFLSRLQAVRDSLAAWLGGTAAPPVNTGAIPESPADGITVDRLIGILDSAKQGDCDDLFALYADILTRDPDFIAGGLQRKSPLVAAPLNASVPPKSGQEHRDNRDFVRRALRRIKGLRFAIAHLMDGAYWPLAVVEKIIKPAPMGSGRFYDVTELREVPFWRLSYRADRNGPAGMLKIKTLNPDGTLTGDTELPSPARYIIHRGHLNQAMPDCWGGPLRAVVFWWYFGNWARTACARHLEGTNLPKWVAKAPTANFKAAKRELQRAFARCVNTTALIIPEDAKVEAISTLQKDSVEAFIQFMALCSKQIAKVVLVQTMTLEGQPQGIGGSQAQVQAGALESVQTFDAALLAETLQQQLFTPILQLSGIAGPVPDVAWGADQDEAAVKVDILEGLFNIGLEPADESIQPLSDLAGVLLRRKLPAPAMGGIGLSAMAAAGPHEENQAALDALAENVAEDLASAFSADSAQLAHALRTARTPAEMLAMARTATAKLAPHRAARVMEDLLATAAANGFTCSHAANPLP